MIPQTRWSDHASFWNRGYPALMLTDTAMFRNPYYHTPYDKYEKGNSPVSTRPFNEDISWMSGLTDSGDGCILFS
ncbi:MAG: M28 family peptidase [Candidatus Brocadia sp.]